MSESRDLCTRVRLLVDSLVDGTVSPADEPALWGHIETCARCAGLVEEARGVDRLLNTWQAPEPPAGLAESACRRAWSASPAVDCEGFSSLLTSWMEGELDPFVAARLRTHAEECLHCAEEQRAAEEADQALAQWTAPQPPEDFADRVLAQLALSSPRHPRPAERVTLAWRRLAVAAVIVVSVGAAAFLVTDLIERNGGASPVTSTPADLAATGTGHTTETDGSRSISAPEAHGGQFTVFVTLEPEDLLPPADPFEPYYADSSGGGSPRGKTLRRTARLVALGGH